MRPPSSTLLVVRIYSYSWILNLEDIVNFIPSVLGFEVIPEEVGLTHAPSGVQLGGPQRQADSAFASWRCGKVPSTSLTSGLSLSTRSSDTDLKEFLVQRGIIDSGKPL